MTMDNEQLVKRVRAAVRAAWYTVIIAAIWMTVAWLFALWLLSSQPDWLITLWGGMVTWKEIHTTMIWFFGAFKLILFVIVMTTIWLTFWSRQLRKV
ncbi:MAG: hypothetical protein JW849_07750 [Phycisphaerae bacterium]|nr:hypothetical protein [Phycisphaerae bacterium]